jgi:hypothetical protein
MHSSLYSNSGVTICAHVIYAFEFVFKFGRDNLELQFVMFTLRSCFSLFVMPLGHFQSHSAVLEMCLGKCQLQRRAMCGTDGQF